MQRRGPSECDIMWSLFYCIRKYLWFIHLITVHLQISYLYCAYYLNKDSTWTGTAGAQVNHSIQLSKPTVLEGYVVHVCMCMCFWVGCCQTSYVYIFLRQLILCDKKFKVYYHIQLDPFKCIWMLQFLYKKIMLLYICVSKKTLVSKKRERGFEIQYTDI
jgi:hypothetical protein